MKWWMGSFCKTRLRKWFGTLCPVTRRMQQMALNKRRSMRQRRPKYVSAWWQEIWIGQWWDFLGVYTQILLNLCNKYIYIILFYIYIDYMFMQVRFLPSHKCDMFCTCCMFGRSVDNGGVGLNPRRILLEKTQGIWGGWCDAHFPWKTQGIVARLVTLH